MKKIATLRANETPRKNSVGHADSVEKILAQISLLTPDEVRYRPTTPSGRVLAERVFAAPVDEVILGPSLFRTFICTSGCTACCQKFTLDYTPHEFVTLVKDKTGFAERSVCVNGKKKVVFTNDQNKNPICDFLTAERPDGGLGCSHYPYPPLSCISAPQLQFIQMRPGRTYIMSKPFGRAWAMTPTPQCQFLPSADPEEYFEQMSMRILILDRFIEWARYFGIKSCLPQAQRKIRAIANEGLVPQLPVSVWEKP